MKNSREHPLPEPGVRGVRLYGLGQSAVIVFTTAGDLGFSAEPVIHIVPILTAALLIQFICPTATRFLQMRSQLGDRSFRIGQSGNLPGQGAPGTAEAEWR